MPAGPRKRVRPRLKDRAVYWGTAEPSPGGQPVYASPIEIRCRWSDETQEIIEPDGTKVVFMTMVITEIKLKEQGVLWKGTLLTLTDPTRPFSNSEAKTIQRVKDTPDQKEEEHLYRAFM